MKSSHQKRKGTKKMIRHRVLGKFAFACGWVGCYHNSTTNTFFRLSCALTVLNQRAKLNCKQS